MIVNVTGSPEQPFATGVTVTVDITADDVVLAAVKEAMLPVPLPANPIAELLLVQLKTVPLTAPLKLTGPVALPAQAVWFEIAATVGRGLTLIVKVVGVPVQVTPLVVRTGVTVMVEVIAALVVLLAMKEAILPEPLAAIPVAVLLFVQL